ncbi:LDL receptor domain-containing protein, partial [Candidatus Woesearchaeota archaeon]|nr:LDL receptor domain-containing protein [Candidatus Woesearchaeota archaeon]
PTDTYCEWQCNNGKCIPQSYVCDGEEDCSKGEDEKNCSVPPDTYNPPSPDTIQGCPEYTCNDGNCIPYGWICDGANDCNSGEDEEECGCPEYTCSDGNCIPYGYFCDGENDCSSGEDEINCGCVADDDCLAGEVCKDGECVAGCVDECDSPGYAGCDGNVLIVCTDYDADPCLEWDYLGDCGAGYVCQDGECISTSCPEYTCNDGNCIPYAYICDGGWDCSSGEDESEAICGCPEYTCSDGSCIPYGYFCDGENDCSSGEDEEGCSVCSSIGLYTCNDGQCIPYDWICDGGADCSNGEDEEGCCVDDIGCSYDGQVFCSGNLPMKCITSLDDDECLDSYNTANNCSISGKVCQDGECVQTCTDECTPSGKKECSGNGWKQCGNYDADTCLDWSTVTPCKATESCSGGICAATCTDECTPSGKKECTGSDLNSWKQCGNYDADSCLEWSTTTDCGMGKFCSSGVCDPCGDSGCEYVGQKLCSDNFVVECGYLQGCLNWVDIYECNAGEICQNGECVTSCTDECTPSGKKECSGNGWKQCGSYDADTCLDWSTVTPCKATETCSGGICAASCTDECSPSGKKECSGNGWKQCGSYDADTCLDWSTVTPCKATESCSGGSCVVACTDECNYVGEKSCNLGGDMLTCGNYDADTCLDWSLTSCAPGTCYFGECIPACTNDCTPLGKKECSGNGWKLCDYYDADPCLEWSAITPCKANETCSSGACKCTDECSPSGKKECSGDGWIQCGNYDADTCLDWSTITSCKNPPNSCYNASGYCTNGQCNYNYNNGATCNDNNECTTKDTCQNGTCKGTPIVPNAQMDQYEGTFTNDKSQNATVLDSTSDCMNGAGIKANIYPKSNNDIDWYKIYVDDAACILYPEFNLYNIPASDDYDLCVYYEPNSDCTPGKVTCLSGSWTKDYIDQYVAPGVLGKALLEGCCSKNVDSLTEYVKLDPEALGCWLDDDGSYYIKIYPQKSSGCGESYSLDYIF